jgi:hypothetical protein
MYDEQKKKSFHAVKLTGNIKEYHVLVTKLILIVPPEVFTKDI